MAIPDGDKQAAAYWQKMLGDSTNRLRKLRADVSSEANKRKLIAYGLKGIAIFGGLAVATGWLPGKAPQIVAVIIAAAVACDQWLSNHARLLAVDQASKALRALIAAVEHRYNIEIGPVISANANGDATAAKQLSEVAKSVYEYVHIQEEQIVKALEETDTAALKRLTLEAEAKQKG